MGGRIELMLLVKKKLGQEWEEGKEFWIEARRKCMGKTDRCEVRREQGKE